MNKALLLIAVAGTLSGCLKDMTPDDVNRLEDVCKSRGFKPLIKTKYFKDIGEMPVSVRCLDEQRGLVYFARNIEKE